MNPATMRLLRQVHTYLGVFFAPAIIFFAFSGALQTFSLHENKGDSPYQPPAWIVALASVHKDQALPAPRKPRPTPAKATATVHAAEPDASPATPRPPSPLPLKIFVLLLSAGLISTALIGLYIALKNPTIRRNVLIALAAGVVLPVLLLFV